MVDTRDILKSIVHNLRADANEGQKERNETEEAVGRDSKCDI